MKKILLMAIVLISINAMADNGKKNAETTVKPSNIETSVEKALVIKNDTITTDKYLLEIRNELRKTVDNYAAKVVNEKTRK